MTVNRSQFTNTLVKLPSTQALENLIFRGLKVKCYVSASDWKEHAACVFA